MPKHHVPSLTVQLMPIEMLRSRIALPAIFVRAVEFLIQPFPAPPSFPWCARGRRTLCGPAVIALSIVAACTVIPTSAALPTPTSLLRNTVMVLRPEWYAPLVPRNDCRMSAFVNCLHRRHLRAHHHILLLVCPTPYCKSEKMYRYLVRQRHVNVRVHRFDTCC